ncbi:MAG TPA: Cof-type HAD-IIB family hydrolase [Propionibacteriaceae bacterium]|nr:Cof-type HAD-IIB family hydrolase [Propionibacteriaceae bacterium]
MELPVFVPRPDIRLIAADMDGTLLDDAKELHDHFWPLADALFERGVLFCPASGRQYQTLHRHFGDVADELLYLAENGAYVVRGRDEISSDALRDDLVARLVQRLRDVASSDLDLGVVVCGKKAAYIERTDLAFTVEVEKYYASRAVVGDLLDRPDDQVLKVAVYDFGSAEHGVAPALTGFATEAQVVVTGEHWVDVMNPETNKGAGLRSIQRTLGITPAQTMVFGDFLNDLEMMDAAEYSFAMHNAHPLLLERARYVAPPNTENGVVRTISSVLGLPWTS